MLRPVVTSRSEDMSFPRYLLALLLAATGVAQAVEFDEKVKAPRAMSGAEIRAKIDTVAARLAPGSVDPLDTIRNASLAREQFDARWMLGTLIDERRPLPELESLGLESQGDGRFQIKSGGRPEWRTLAESLSILSDPEVLSKLAPVFSVRGFRPEDQAALLRYVSSHDLKRARDEAMLKLLISTSKKAKKLEKLKRLNDNVMASFFYQKRWLQMDTERRWAVGLLDSLEPQAQRILSSYFSELDTTTLLGPEDISAAYRHERELLLRPDFEQIARTAFEEGKL
jgi:hypothetical protein